REAPTALRRAVRPWTRDWSPAGRRVREHSAPTRLPHDDTLDAVESRRRATDLRARRVQSGVDRAAPDVRRAADGGGLGASALVVILSAAKDLLTRHRTGSTRVDPSSLCSSG